MKNHSLKLVFLVLSFLCLRGQGDSLPLHKGGNYPARTNGRGRGIVNHTVAFTPPDNTRHGHVRNACLIPVPAPKKCVQNNRNYTHWKLHGNRLLSVLLRENAQLVLICSSSYQEMLSNHEWLRRIHFSPHH